MSFSTGSPSQLNNEKDTTSITNIQQAAIAQNSSTELMMKQMSKEIRRMNQSQQMLFQQIFQEMIHKVIEADHRIATIFT